MKIKIKYLDDSQREVQARLTDKLGGFKRVHFAGDMSDDRTVRLIFNGHVLNADSQTLEQGSSFCLSESVSLFRGQYLLFKEEITADHYLSDSMLNC